MGDVLLFPGDGLDAVPWYADRDLVGTDDGFGFDRILPADVFVPHEHVLATVHAAVWWGKTVTVSWMQMDMDAAMGCEVPMQHHAKGSAVMWVDDCGWTFGVSEPDDMHMQRVQMDCVTDIRLDLITELPKSWVEIQAERKQAHDQAIARVTAAIKSVAVKAGATAEELPAGCQVDG